MTERFVPSRSDFAFLFEIVDRDDDFVRCRVPFSEALTNTVGSVQAGLMLWLADLAATTLAGDRAEIADDGSGFPLLIDLHASLLSNQREGDIFAEARIVRQGRRITVVRTRVTGPGDQTLAEVTTTHLAA